MIRAEIVSAIFLTYAEHKPTGFAGGLEGWYNKSKCEKGDTKVFPGKWKLHFLK